MQFDIGSIIHTLNLDGRSNDGAKVLNWNPHITDDLGVKHYYQRPFVWTLINKIDLIDSIYNRLECGKIVVRRNDFNKVNNDKSGEQALYDIVDGKQRLDALRGFVSNEFPDRNGHFFREFDIRAQRMFKHQMSFSYCEMHEEVTDEQVLIQFIKVNVAGVPQSEEHIQYVKSLLVKVK
jgi:hypothetical protein